jgi:Tfp pilus assembly protein PilN
MIEINLLPGSTKRAPRRGLPGLAGASALSGKLQAPKFDRTLGMIVGAWVVGLGAAGWLYFSTDMRMSQLEVELEAAIRDSTRYEQLRAQGDSLMKQESVIGQKMQVIHTIDAGRYVWSHIMDEVSRALPAYIWLTEVSEVEIRDGLPRFKVLGKAGNTFALTRFMDELESSPFLHQVRLISSEHERVDTRTVHKFVLELAYQEPPADVIQTTPLFSASAQEE